MTRWMKRRFLDPERLQKEIYNTFLAYEIECKRRLCRVKGPCERYEKMKPCSFVSLTKKYLDRPEVWSRTFSSLERKVAKSGLELKRGNVLPSIDCAGR